MAARICSLAMIVMLGGCCLTIVSGNDINFEASGASTGSSASSGGGTSHGNSSTSTGTGSGGGSSTAGQASVTSSGSSTGGVVCVPIEPSNLQSTSTYANSLGAIATASGDLNGDGLLDLVVGASLVYDGGGADFAIFLGQADGGLSAPQVSYPDGGLIAATDIAYFGAADSLALGDFDSDGRLDIVIAYSSSVLVFLNDDRGALVEPTSSISASQTVFGIGIGDLNGDGLNDLVLAEFEHSAAVELVLATSPGKFATPVPLPGLGGTRFGSLVVADLNQDGVPDIAADTSDGSHLAVLINRGDGTFTTSLYPIPVNAQLTILPRAGAAPDLLLGNAVVENGQFEPSGTIQILTNAGDGTFSIGPSYTAPGAMFFAVADFNGDCIPDIATSIFWNCGMLGTGMSVLYGDGAGGFGAPVALKAQGFATAQLAILGAVGGPRALASVDACGAGITVFGGGSE